LLIIFQISVQELGRFHGSCYALKHKRPEKFNSIIAKFNESRYSRDMIDPMYDMVMKIGPKRAIKTTRER
jgi:hypothetical protein